VFIPLGPGDQRRMVPLLTLILIGLNIGIHLLTHYRVREEENALRGPMVALYKVEEEIELKHRGAQTLFAAFFDAKKDQKDSVDFWQRWERGEVVPKTDPDWLRWDDARRSLERARDGLLLSRLALHRDHPTLLGLVAHAFMHDGNLHVLGNMLFLWTVGANMEDAWGRRWFALLYALGIVSAAAIWLITTPRGQGQHVVGASGAIAAVMGAMAVRHHHRPLRVLSLLPVPGIYRIPAAWLLVPYFILDVIHLQNTAEDGVAYAAHVGGFATGAVLAFTLKLGGTEASTIAPVVELERARNDLQRLYAASDKRFEIRDVAGGLEILREAVRAHPDELEARERLVAALGLLPDRSEQFAEGNELLARAWRRGRRERFLELFEWIEQQTGQRLPGSLAHKAASVLERRDAMSAARMYLRALNEAPDDPLTVQSLTRYAAMLEQLGRTDDAAQVRAMAQQRRRSGPG
jgi:membrane associated rhomboid family serine protease